jgi:hypothetical protein
VQDGHPACRWQTVIGQIAEGIDIAKFRPFSGGFGHFLFLLGNFTAVFDWRVREFYCNATN